MRLRVETDGEWLRAEATGAALGSKRSPGVALRAPAAVAYVNQGRWIANCPFPGCGGARGLNPTLTGYWCAYCGNGGVAGQEVPVVWPANLDEIESILVLRPNEVNRNWSPLVPVPGRNRVGEDAIMDLCVENLERGVPVPTGMRAAVDVFVEADWEVRGIAEEMKGWNVEPRRKVSALRGPKGDKGDPGPPGPKGDKGDPGTPADVKVVR